MKTIIIISKKHGTHSVLVDDEDHAELTKRPWFLWMCECGNLYAKTRYLDPNNPRKRFPMHRVIMGITDPKIMVDHKDRNTLNNQKSNLRIATPRQNSVNRKPKSKLGVKGVIKAPSGNYSVSLRINGVVRHMGTFPTIKAAALKYNELAKAEYGEFAYQNPV